MHNTYKKLYAVQDIVGGTIRKSLRNVPFLLFEHKGFCFSVVWFNTSKKYRMFYPHGLYKTGQLADSFTHAHDAPAVRSKLYDSRELLPGSKPFSVIHLPVNLTNLDLCV